MTTKETGRGIGEAATFIVQSLLGNKGQESEEWESMQRLLGLLAKSRGIEFALLKKYGETATEMIKGTQRTVRKTPKINITNYDDPTGIIGTIHLEHKFKEYYPNGDDSQDPISVVLEQPGQEPRSLFLLRPFSAFSLGEQLRTPAQFRDLKTVMEAIAEAYSEPKSSYEKAISETMVVRELLDG